MTLPPTSLNPKDIMDRCRTTLTMFRRVKEQHREVHDQVEATESGRGEESAQAKKTAFIGHLSSCEICEQRDGCVNYVVSDEMNSQKSKGREHTRRRCANHGDRRDG